MMAAAVAMDTAAAAVPPSLLHFCRGPRGHCRAPPFPQASVYHVDMARARAPSGSAPPQ